MRVIAFLLPLFDDTTYTVNVHKTMCAWIYGILNSDLARLLKPGVRKGYVSSIQIIGLKSKALSEKAASGFL